MPEFRVIAGMGTVTQPVLFRLALSFLTSQVTAAGVAPSAEAIPTVPYWFIAVDRLNCTALMARVEVGVNPMPWAPPRNVPSPKLAVALD